MDANVGGNLDRRETAEAPTGRAADGECGKVSPIPLYAGSGTGRRAGQL